MDDELNNAFNEIGRLLCVVVSPSTETAKEMKQLEAVIKSVGELRKMMNARQNKKWGE